MLKVPAFRAFTLIELLTVIAIIAVLAAIGLAIMHNNSNKHSFEVINGHQYIIRRSGFGQYATEAMAHDPDCPCSR